MKRANSLLVAQSRLSFFLLLFNLFGELRSFTCNRVELFQLKLWLQYRAELNGAFGESRICVRAISQAKSSLLSKAFVELSARELTNKGALLEYGKPWLITRIIGTCASASMLFFSLLITSNWSTFWS